MHFELDCLERSTENYGAIVERDSLSDHKQITIKPIFVVQKILIIRCHFHQQVYTNNLTHTDKPGQTFLTYLERKKHRKQITPSHNSNNLDTS